MYISYFVSLSYLPYFSFLLITAACISRARIFQKPAYIQVAITVIDKRVSSNSRTFIIGNGVRKRNCIFRPPVGWREKDLDTSPFFFPPGTSDSVSGQLKIYFFPGKSCKSSQKKLLISWSFYLTQIYIAKANINYTY